MMPQRAYVLLPTQIVRTLRGMRKYSTERARANELGGTMHTSPVNSTNDLGSKCLGSTTAESALVKILKDRKSTRLNSSHSQISYAVFCLKKKTQATLLVARQQQYDNRIVDT